MVPGLDPDPTHLCDRGDEGLLECRVVRCEQVDRGPRSRICEQRLVRDEEALSLLEVLEVDVVERLRRCGVHVDGDSGVHVDRAHLPQLQRVAEVQVRVDPACWAEVVDPLGEFAAVRETNRVRTYIQNGFTAHVMLPSKNLTLAFEIE